MGRKIISITLIIVLLLSITGCGSSKMYASGKDGYTTITFIDGISFEVVSSVARNATAITNMSSSMAYETNQTYLYKDGENSYFIFNMSSLVCIAQKGTTFHFSESKDMKDSLENGSNVLGVWFDCPKRKTSSRDESKNGVYKCIIDANAQVSLTPDIYGDFSGQLATIEYQGEEWALYIGTLGSEGYEKLSKEMQKSIGYMVQSMNLYQKAELPEESAPPVSIGGKEDVSGNDIQPTLEPTEIPEKKVPLNETEEEKSSVSTETPEVIQKIEDIEVSVEEPVIEKEKVTEEPSVEDIPLATPSTEPDPSKEPEKYIEENTVSPTPTSRRENSYIQQNNQKNIQHEDNTVYTTDIYSMLEPGKRSNISMLNNEKATDGVVKVIEVLTEKDAVQLIKKKCTEGNLKYEYFRAPDGCSWQAVHYQVEAGSGYVNVKLRGLDGENLRFRGIEYSQRTYDIQISDTEFYSYYAVPNACPEYALEIGEGTINNDLKSGYYLIQEKGVGEYVE